MISAAWSLQLSVFDALATDPNVQASLGNPVRVFDAFPEDIVFPFVQMGAAQCRPYEGVEGGEEHILRFTIFSRWGGRKECKTIAATIHDVLQNAQLSLDEHQLILARRVFADHLRHRDPETFQSSLRYRFVTIPTDLVEAA